MHLFIFHVCDILMLLSVPFAIMHCCLTVIILYSYFVYL